MAVSPDGRWIFYAQVDQAGSDLMLVRTSGEAAGADCLAPMLIVLVFGQPKKPIFSLNRPHWPYGRLTGNYEKLGTRTSNPKEADFVGISCAWAILFEIACRSGRLNQEVEKPADDWFEPPC